MTGEPITDRRDTALLARIPRPVLLAGLALVLAGVAIAPAVGAPGQDGAKPAAERRQEGRDPVVTKVLEMLRGGVAEPVIVTWLEKSGSRPAAVSSDDLIALHKAGASNDLQQRLLESATGPREPAAPPPPAASGSAAPSPPAAAAPAPAAPPAAAASPAPAAAPPPAGAAAAAAGRAAAVKVRFVVTYRPVFVDEEEPWPQRWQLFLYVDGHYAGSVKAGPVLLPLPGRTVERELAPGKHLLRLTQERHLRYNRVTGYVSPARVDPSEFPFELPPAAANQAVQVSIQFGEKSIRHPGPVTVRIEQDGRQLADLEPEAANPEAWPALCEDVPTAVPAGAKLPGKARHDLEGCVHWADLWPGLTVPSREQVRAELGSGGQAPGATN